MTVVEKLRKLCDKLKAENANEAMIYTVMIGALAQELDRIEASIGVKAEPADPNQWSNNGPTDVFGAAHESKGGTNPPNTSTIRPPAPLGSGASHTKGNSP